MHRRVHARGLPKAHHMAPPDLAIRQRQLCSGARPSAQPKSLLATRSELLPITSRARNERNANTEVLDFMHGWMTSRHEGCVSTMLTDKRLKYSTVGAPLQGSAQRNRGCKTESTALRGVFGLDIVLPFERLATLFAGRDRKIPPCLRSDIPSPSKSHLQRLPGSVISRANVVDK